MPEGAGYGLLFLLAAWGAVFSAPFLIGIRFAILSGGAARRMFAAARAIGMSYRRAWWHVETMNRLAKRPLVETAVGGKGGGGTRLTPEGEEAVRLYRALDGRAKAFEERVKKELSE